MSTGGRAPVQYLAARQWLVHYAERGAEWSPMREEAYLPAGRKSFYYTQYYFEVTAGQPGAVECTQCSRQCVRSRRRVASPQTLSRSPDLVIASLKVFLEAWRVECPWIIICKSVCMFTKCGLCEYLKVQIDKVPRGLESIREGYIRRLGEHYRFQEAQRLAQARVEEACAQSAGRKWFMKMDKADQKKI